MNQESQTPSSPSNSPQVPASKASSTKGKPPTEVAPNEAAAPEEKPQPTKEELLAQLVANLAENVALYEEIFALIGDDATRMPPDVRPEKHDLVMLYDVKLIGKDGILSRLKGRADFPESLHPHGMATTMRNFQRIFTTMVGEPLSVKLNRILSDLGLSLTEDENLPHLPPTTAAKQPYVEDSRENGHLLSPED